MELPYLDTHQVEQLLPMSRCIDLMAEAAVAVRRGQAILPQRLIAPLPTPLSHNLFATMPGALSVPAVFGAKLVSIFPDNPQHQVPAIQGVIVLFDLAGGQPLALVDAASVTAIRTAAASAAATRMLAREDASVLALLGSGVQAMSHLEAVLAVRPISEVRVWGRSQAGASNFSARAASRFGLAVNAVEDAGEAVRGADIVCTVTGSAEPVLQGEWLAPGSHINLVGAHSADTREADTDTIRRARVFVEVERFADSEAGDLLIPLRAGEISPSHIVGEIAAVIEGELPGRCNRQEITLYKSLGNTAQDLVAANAVFQAWRDGHGESAGVPC